MKIILCTFLCCAILTACGPYRVEPEATAAPKAANEELAQATLTASATTTPFPSPTATQTPIPTGTPDPTFTPTAAPTMTPVPRPKGTLEEITQTYQYFVAFEVISEEIIEITGLLVKGTIDKDRANNRLQVLHHALRKMEGYSQMSEVVYAETNGMITELYGAYEGWWSSKLDAQALSREISIIQEMSSSRRKSLYEYLLANDSLDEVFESEFLKSVDQLVDQSDEIIAYDRTSDMFQMQRQQDVMPWGGISTLGHFDLEKGYTSPDGTFRCGFVFQGWSEILYDFIFPERTLVVLTNDSGLGQAVERYPLQEPLYSGEPSLAPVEELFQNTILPALNQQHANLRIVDQKWVELSGNPPRAALQVIMILPSASYVYEQTPLGNQSVDVVRGIWIFAVGDGIYVTGYQTDIGLAALLAMDPAGSNVDGSLTDLEIIQLAEAGLQEFDQACTYK